MSKISPFKNRYDTLWTVDEAETDRNIEMRNSQPRNKHTLHFQHFYNNVSVFSGYSLLQKSTNLALPGFKSVVFHLHTEVQRIYSLRSSHCQRDLTITFKLGQQTLAVAPLQLKDVEADEILQVHQNNHQRVELISKPEICKLHPVKWCSEYAKLETDNSWNKVKRCIKDLKKTHIPNLYSENTLIDPHFYNIDLRCYSEFWLCVCAFNTRSELVVN